MRATMPSSPLVTFHLACALAALATGPLALWTPRAPGRHPRLHRVTGRAWVALMLAASLSAVFIRDFSQPNLGGYTAIHLLVPVTWVGLLAGLRALRRGQLGAHRKTMAAVYSCACVGAGAFALLPGRYLGNLLWRQVLGGA